MIENLRRMLLEPRHPHRYIGRHRMPSGLPIISISIRRAGEIAG